MDLLGICMGILDLTYKLIALKSKCKALDRIYFMSQVFQEHSHSYGKGKNKKREFRKFIYFSFHPSLSRRGGGGGEGNNPPPTSFFHGNNF